VLIDSPILTPAACEGTSTLFETDYFDSKAYLSQSGQLYLVPACLAEDLIVTVVQRALERCAPELKTLERNTARLEKIRKPFPRLTYDEASVHLLQPEVADRARAQDAPPFVAGNDFGCFDGTVLTEGLDRPLMVTHYPAAIKAFYMQPDPDRPDRALCVDVLALDAYGEIIGGSQRIHDHDLLLRRLEEHRLPLEAFRWYLDLRRYGSVPHAGFGMGIERLVAWIGGVHHLCEAIPYPRTLNRIYP
jgi:asparaginyl-tRNA synthetase